MRTLRILAFLALAILILAIAIWLAKRPAAARSALPAAAPPSTQPILRIGLIPERNIFRQRQIHQAMAAYIGQKLARPVELVTASQYRGILQDFAEKRVDLAFIGSLTTTLAVDRLGARVLVSPELDLNVRVYRGVLFVRDDSPISRVEDLAGRSIAMTRATTGGSLYGIHELARHGMLGKPNSPRILWVGSHDDGVFEVAEGRADAACVKDLRLDDYEMRHPQMKMRRLSTGQAVPENAVVVRADLADELGPRLTQILLAMHEDPAGRDALKTYGATRFRPCSIAEYKAIYDMIDDLGPLWPQVGMDGPPPRRPAEVPATRPAEARARFAPAASPAKTDPLSSQAPNPQPTLP